MSEQHPIHDDGMQEIVESFVVEATEIYDGLEGDLLQLEKTPEDEELVDSVFRDVHTVKGTAGFLDLEQLSTLAHRFEEVLDAMREQEVDFEPAMTDVMLCAFDHMKVLTQQVIDRDLEPLEMEPLLDALEAINEGTFEAGAVSLPDPDGGAPEEVGGDAAGGADEPTDADGTGDTEGAASPDAGEPSDDTSSTDGDGGDGDSGRKAPDTIRVEVSRLNQLMDLVGELVLGRNRLLQLITEARTEHDARADTDERLRLDSLLGELEEASDKVDYTTTELQSAIMQTRMVEVGQVFGKFPRVVRDLAREFDKQIDLTVEGEDTELDKSLVEEIGDPLLHLVRNAADHGIEPPEERKEKGKDPRGEIHLSASHAGNHIIIEIADDGAGLDPDALRRKAIEKDVLTEDEATDLSDSEAYQLIFRPGFSTTEEVGQVSGRGVGMDVVKTNLAELNGTIDIDSTPGEGTRFTLKLPLTLAILQSMLVRSG
ncbi:chemotaxis protein CheA, partial [Salinibacter ruber]